MLKPAFTAELLPELGLRHEERRSVIRDGSFFVSPAAYLLLCQIEQLNVFSSAASYVHIYIYIFTFLFQTGSVMISFNNQSKLQGFWHKLVRRRMER